MQIIRQHVDELHPDLMEDLKLRVDREFGDVPIVVEHTWSDPDWVIMAEVDREICSFLCLIDRIVKADGNDVHFFGVNNVITEPQHRGKGYSTALNRSAIEFMKEADEESYGFLFCADDLLPFYEKLGWQKFHGEVTVWQPSGDKNWTSNCMYHDLTGDRSVNWQRVHLCGPPW